MIRLFRSPRSFLLDDLGFMLIAHVLRIGIAAHELRVHGRENLIGPEQERRKDEAWVFQPKLLVILAAGGIDGRTFATRC
jgi:hypothetical protein